ncbi:uncharacterized protein OCT59_028944 [Rhizophagus irregularis]|uniref:uncharacterized protein n=1 Tax=Rhizophagus irregularis TaxID=588596 RepID=UPI00331FADCA|nr:hypothetical protein OCT59_028944 [Rhizophagus irregularis]
MCTCLMGCLRFIITFQDTLFLNSKTEVIKAHLQPSGALQSSDALSPSITIQPSDVTDTLLKPATNSPKN